MILSLPVLAVRGKAQRSELLNATCVAFKAAWALLAQAEFLDVSVNLGACT